MNVEDLYRLLRSGHMQAQGIVDTIEDPMLVLDDTLRIQAASRSFLASFKVNRDETIGQRLYDIGNGQWDIPELRTLLLQVVPKSTAVINYQVEHEFPELGRRIMLLTARTLFHPDNASHSLLLVIVDVTERAASDAAKDMLFGELRHRIKNLFGVAQSIARHTTTAGRSADEYRDAFLGRFNALVAAQDLAFAEQDGMGLGVLIERILAPHRSDLNAVVIEHGAAVALSPSTIMSLSLILHELATNAAKYGALSIAGGQVRVEWGLADAHSTLRLKWGETNGPPVIPPAATGYGTKLIKLTTSYGLRGKAELNYAVSGLEAEIVIPVGKAALPG